LETTDEDAVNSLDDEDEHGEKDIQSFVTEAVATLRTVVDDENKNAEYVKTSDRKLKRRYSSKRKSTKDFYTFKEDAKREDTKDGYLADGAEVEQDSSDISDQPSVRSNSSGISGVGGRKKFVYLSTVQLTSLVMTMLASCCFSSSTFDPASFAYSRINLDGMSSVSQFVAGKVGNAGSHGSYSCDGTPACKKCFCLYFGISSSTYGRVKHSLETGRRHNFGRKKANRMKGVTTATAIAWVEAYASIYGDFQPDFNEIHLPDLKWKELYGKYEREMNKQKNVSMSRGGFINICHKYVHWVRLRTFKRFAQCDECSDLNSKMDSAKTDTTKQCIRRFKDKHIDWQARERGKYHKHRAKALRYPDKYMSMNFDGMDHSKTSLPAFKRESKSSGELERLNVHVTGVLVHNGKQRAYVYTWLDNFPADSNVSIHTILDVINKMKAKGPLPPTLYIQADNCWRENKNKFLMGFLHCLVEDRVFKKIKLSFLPKGHTHEDVDQMFSRFAVALKGQHTISIDDLHTLFENSYLPKPNCTWVKSMACWNKYLDTYLDHVDGVSKPAVFIVKRALDGVVRHHYKLEMQVRKSEFPSCILPRNHIGYQMYENNGYPKLSSDRIPAVPMRGLRLKELTNTSAWLNKQDYLDDKQKQWWVDMLAEQNDAEENRCLRCKSLRESLNLTRVNHADPKDISRAKGRMRYKLDKALLKHLMKDNSSSHDAFPVVFPSGSEFQLPIRPSNLNGSGSDSDPESDDDEGGLPRTDRVDSGVPNTSRVVATTLADCLLSDSEVENKVDESSGFSAPSPPAKRHSQAGARLSRRWPRPDPSLAFSESGSASESYWVGSRNHLQKDELKALAVGDMVLVVPPTLEEVGGSAEGWEYWLKMPFWLGEVLEIHKKKEGNTEAKFSYQLYGMPKTHWKGKYYPGWLDKSKCTRTNRVPEEIYTQNGRGRKPYVLDSDGDSVYFWFQISLMTKNHCIPKRVFYVVVNHPRYIARCTHLGISKEWI
jgi:hypothetical protein